MFLINVNTAQFQRLQLLSGFQEDGAELGVGFDNAAVLVQQDNGRRTVVQQGPTKLDVGVQGFGNADQFSGAHASLYPQQGGQQSGQKQQSGTQPALPVTVPNRLVGQCHRLVRTQSNQDDEGIIIDTPPVVQAADIVNGGSCLV